MNNVSRNTLFDIEKIFNHRVPAYRYYAKEQKQRAVGSPSVDINDNLQNYQLIAELPGVDKANIHVSIDDSILCIETKKPKLDKPENEIKAIQKERYQGDFKRTFNLGDDVDQSAVKAQFENGLLILTLPKVKEVLQEPTKIEIH